MENKYFTPDMEDFHIGYECEISTPTIWKSGKFPEILELNSELDEFGKDSFMKAAHAILRVPYLTKEQIEAEGWNKANIPIVTINNDFYEIPYIKHNFRIDYNFKNNLINILENNGKNLFYGKCKDINTFRKICKLLEI